MCNEVDEFSRSTGVELVTRDATDFDPKTSESCEKNYHRPLLYEKRLYKCGQLLIPYRKFILRLKVLIQSNFGCIQVNR